MDPWVPITYSFNCILYVRQEIRIELQAQDNHNRGRKSITTTRNDLDCTNTSITDGTKLNCLTVDIVMPYLIWFFVSAGLGYLAGSQG